MHEELRFIAVHIVRKDVTFGVLCFRCIFEHFLPSFPLLFHHIHSYLCTFLGIKFNFHCDSFYHLLIAFIQSKTNYPIQLYSYIVVIFPQQCALFINI